MRVRGRARQAAALAGAALLVTGVLAGCDGSTSPEPSDKAAGDTMSSADAGDDPGSPGLPASITSQKPDWKRCEAAGSDSDPGPGWRCATVDVPRIDRNPLPTASGRELNESLAITGIVQPLYSESSWPYLTDALDEAEKSGTGNGLLQLADSYNGRDESGHYDTQSHSQRAISCADTRTRPTVSEARALLPEFRKLSPVFGPFLAWDTAGWCAQWPVDGEHDTPEASAPGAGPILVIGTTGDPATPYEGAQKMADELGEGVGIMVTNKGEGHGAYGESACVTSVVDDYFLNGKVPEDGRACP